MTSLTSPGLNPLASHCYPEKIAPDAPGLGTPQSLLVG